MGLAHLLTHDFGIPLAQASVLAERALEHPPGSRALTLVRASDESAALVVDLARYHSTFASSLSAALQHATPRRRGRPLASESRTVREPIAAAAAHGVDVSLLRESLRRTPVELLESLDEDVAFLADLRPVNGYGTPATRRAG